MLCPVCGNEKTKVDDSRPDEKDNTRINRRRSCVRCGIGWPTREVPENIYFEMMKIRGKTEKLNRIEG